jgi:predicted nucleic acid-binding protein
MGFLRHSMQPAVVKTAISFGDALKALTISVSAPEHEFWPLESSFQEIDEEILSRIGGHHQIADALLLDLAERHSGRLASFDRRIATLLPATSVSQSAIELIPA